MTKWDSHQRFSVGVEANSEFFENPKIFGNLSLKTLVRAISISMEEQENIEDLGGKLFCRSFSVMRLIHYRLFNDSLTHSLTQKVDKSLLGLPFEGM